MPEPPALVDVDLAAPDYQSHVERVENNAEPESRKQTFD